MTSNSQTNGDTQNAASMGLNGTASTDIPSDKVKVAVENGTGNMEETHHKHTRWGWFGITPDSFQRFNTGFSWGVTITITNIAANFCIIGLLGLVITSLERRFDMSSNHTAWISNAAEIGPVPVYILILIFGRKANRPKLCAIGTLVVGLGAALFILPHFTTNTYLPTEEVIDGNVCEDREAIDCVGESSLKNYMWVFIFARFLMGGGSAVLNTIALTYLEDNVNNQIFGLMLGLVQGAMVIGPAVAYVIGGIMLTWYTDFPTIGKEELGFDDTDPRWVGAWWLPYFIGAALLFLCVPFVAAFPKHMPGSEAIIAARKVESHLTEKAQGIDHLDRHSASLKTLFIGIIKNPVFMTLSFFQFLNAFIISGFVTFGAKFVEVQFARTAATAGTMWGMTVVVGGIAGSLLGGLLIKKFNLTSAAMIKIEMFTSLVIAAMTFASLLNCEPNDFAGVNIDYYNSTPISDDNQLLSTCNQDCTCTDIPYDPICGIDKIRYYSPCYAGCERYETVDLDKEFYDCSCIPTDDVLEPSAFVGDCDTAACNMIYVVIVLFLIIVTLLLMVQTMNLATVVRIVKPYEKDMALTFYWSGIRLLGNTPGTLALGEVFNSNCDYWEDKCGTQGACLVQDVGGTSLDLTFVVVGVKVLAQVFIVAAFFIYKPPKEFLPEHEVTINVNTSASDDKDSITSSEHSSTGSSNTTRSDKKQKLALENGDVVYDNSAPDTQHTNNADISVKL